MRRVVRLLVIACVALALQACNDDCPELQEEARALRDEAAACSAGDSCIIVDMYDIAGQNNCLLTFQCHKAVNANTDLDAFRRSARRIVKDYSGCSECAIASCFNPEMQIARCDETQGACVLEERP
jgi:hypothetical protein